MARYRHKITKEVISQRTFDDLYYSQQKNYVEIEDRNGSGSGDFLTSAIIGAATDSALLGGLLGGSMTGGLMGDLFDGDLFD